MRVYHNKKLMMWHVDEDGQDLVEYSLIVMLVLAVVVGAVTLLGAQILGLYSLISGIVP